ncbi:hypothetical protein D3C73_1509920 [compost metagenome]
MLIFFVAKGTPYIVIQKGLIIQLLGIGDERPAFPGRHQLELLEAENPCITYAAGTFTLPFSAMRMASVFHDKQIELVGNFLQAVHIA